MLDAMLRRARPDALDRPGGVFIRRADLLEPEDARDAPGDRARPRDVRRRGPGADPASRGPTTLPQRQLGRPSAHGRPRLRASAPDRRRAAGVRQRHAAGSPNRRYVRDSRATADAVPPAPWVNVIANPHAGFLRRASVAAAFAWAENSYFYRLTPWFNDPVAIRRAKCCYLRDDGHGRAVERHAGARPRSDAAVHRASRAGRIRVRARARRHRHRAHDWRWPPTTRSVKISRLRLTNERTAARRLTLTSYVEWVLGAVREHTQHQVHTRIDAAVRGDVRAELLRPAVRDVGGLLRDQRAADGTHGGPREFLGRNGDLATPAALTRQRWSARRAPAGAGYRSLRGAAVRRGARARRDARDRRAARRRRRAGRGARASIARYRRGQAARAAVDGRTSTAWDERLSRDPACRRPSRRSTRCSTAGRCTRRSPAACGRARRSTRAAARTASAISCRTCMAFVYAEPAIAREHIAARRGAPVRRGRRAALVAPAERARRAHALLRRSRLAAVRRRSLRARHRRPRRARRATCRSSTMRPLAPDEHEVYDLPQRQRRARRRSTSTACARSTGRARAACTGCRSSAAATGTTA